ncbi:MAG: hypothetical protein WDZ76_12280 [Pseudohongiellaceae bacterium]
MNVATQRIKSGLCHRITFVDDNAADVDVEKIQYRQVFPRLRHDTVVRGDNHQRSLRAADRRQHVLHEINMTGQIDEAECARDRRIGDLKVQIRETGVNAESARSLFRERVGIDARNALYQCCLAMIDMSGNGDSQKLAGRHGENIECGRGWMILACRRRQAACFGMTGIGLP